MVTVGTSNIKINRESLIERGRKIGMSEYQLEELTNEELSHLITLKELKDY